MLAPPNSKVLDVVAGGVLRRRGVIQYELCCKAPPPRKWEGRGEQAALPAMTTLSVSKTLPKPRRQISALKKGQFFTLLFETNHADLCENPHRYGQAAAPPRAAPGAACARERSARSALIFVWFWVYAVKWEKMLCFCYVLCLTSELFGHISFTTTVTYLSHPHSSHPLNIIDAQARPSPSRSSPLTRSTT